MTIEREIKERNNLKKFEKEEKERELYKEQ